MRFNGIQPSSNICLETIEMVQTMKQEIVKNRQMYYITDGQQDKISQVNQDIDKLKEGMGNRSFEHVYGIINERFINTIIDKESENHAKQTKGINMLLINEQNFETQKQKQESFKQSEELRAQ
jgi:hypothetical protein